MKKKSGLLTFVLSSLSLVIGIGIRGVEAFSILENRELITHPTIDFNSFIQKISQGEIEEFLNDQILLGEWMKKTYHEVENQVNEQLVALFEHDEVYTSLGNYLYNYGNSDYMVYKKDELVDLSKMNQFIEHWNLKLKEIGIPSYLYYVTTSSVLDFNQPYLEDVYYETLRHLQVDKRSRLTISDFEQFKNLFYKTDHHWNHKGSYQGYLDICDMLKIEPIQYIQEVNHHIESFGSSARILSNFKNSEDFTTYQFEEVNGLITLVNGEVGVYGHESDYYRGNIEPTFAMNHYAYYYGDDVGEVHFINPLKEGSLCIIGTSYDNAIVKLLAASYRDVYVIDLRCYEMDLDEKFDLQSYVENHQIDQLLLVGDQYFFMEGE